MENGEHRNAHCFDVFRGVFRCSSAVLFVRAVTTGPQCPQCPYSVHSPDSRYGSMIRRCDVYDILLVVRVSSSVKCQDMSIWKFTQCRTGGNTVLQYAVLGAQPTTMVLYWRTILKGNLTTMIPTTVLVYSESLTTRTCTSTSKSEWPTHCYNLCNMVTFTAAQPKDYSKIRI